MDNREVFQPINDAISQSSTDLSHVFGYGQPKWYGLALSDIAVAIQDGEEIEFTDTNVTLGDTDDDFTVNIVLFTTNLLIRVKGTSSASRDERTTTVLDRGTLAALEINAGTSAFTTDFPNNWPGRLVLKLTYSGGLTLQLPASRSANRQQHERVSSLVPALRDDLTKH